MMHTPGPWKADIRSGCLAVYPAREDHNCLSGARQWAIHYSNKDAEQTQGGGWTMSEEARANARLIAAAPDMLALLKDWAEASEPWAWPGRAGLVENTRALLEELGP